MEPNLELLCCGDLLAKNPRPYLSSYTAFAVLDLFPSTAEDGKVFPRHNAPRRSRLTEIPDTH